MTTRNILKLGDPLLRKKAATVSAAEIQSKELQALIDDLIETMRTASGAGIAAPQIGESLRICVLEVRDNPRYPSMNALPLRVWVNPHIEVLAPFPKVEMYEGCLSVPGLRGKVTRSANIHVTSLGRHGESQQEDFIGALAAVAQHEVDHLHGVLFVDHAPASSLCFLEEFEKHIPPEERLRIIEGNAVPAP